MQLIFLFVLSIITVIDGQAPASFWSSAASGTKTKTINGRAITLNGKPLPVDTVALKAKVANHLYEASLKEREDVWSLMDKLTKMVDKVNNESQVRSKARSMDEIEGRIDDMVLDKDDLEDLIEDYKADPTLMIIEDNSPFIGPKGPSGPKTGTTIPVASAISASGPLTYAPPPSIQIAFAPKRAKKWKLPIKYKVKGPRSSLIKEATDVWKKHTCIRFKKKSGLIIGPNIVFRKWNRRGCWSRVGQKRISQTINLGTGCHHVATVVHEIGHALGFMHEQNRYDRGKYVNIYKKNIKFGKRHNFWKTPKRKSITYNLPYDYSSIMHYNMYSFSKNRKKTLSPKKAGFEGVVGQREELSFYDAKAANLRYCTSKCKHGLTWSKCKNGGYKYPNKCSVCKCPDGLGGTYCTSPARSQPTSTSCGDTTLTAKSTYKEFTSPGYSSGKYSTKHECSWLITAPRGKRVQLEFISTFRLICRTPCADFVEVRYKNLGDPAPRYCCSSRPTTTFKSTGRQMLINFRTFAGSKERGFKARATRFTENGHYALH